MIMNYQIPLKAKNGYATISFSRRNAQFGQLVLELKLSHYMPGQALSAPGDEGGYLSLPFHFFL